MNENIKEKIKELEEAIERYSVDDELVTVCGDTLVLIYVDYIKTVKEIYGMQI